MNNARFPMFISLDNKRIIIFGGGKVACRRANTLLLFHANVTVIAPQMCEELEGLVLNHSIQLMKNSYKKQYIEKDTFMVIAATNDESVNEIIYKECKELNILVNNASNQLQCDFFFPAVIMEDDIIVGITGNGSNHKKVSNFTHKIREEIEVIRGENK